MNLRDIKKDIEYFIGEFIDDCSLFIALNPSRSDSGVSEIIDEAVELYNDLREKINSAKKGAGKAYYNGIRQEMIEKLDELSEKLSTAISSGK